MDNHINNNNSRNGARSTKATAESSVAASPAGEDIGVGDRAEIVSGVLNPDHVNVAEHQVQAKISERFGESNLLTSLEGWRSESFAIQQEKAFRVLGFRV